ncbi:cohesin domain-containing protein [Cellulosimicrobium sp. NPDC055967]|uniref:cohesin domain-containing protein n=1 Tax=Cellulosimicrobium sp. NPDC055967 TaxID=3345670 RepID=UPI0035DE001E
MTPSPSRRRLGRRAALVGGLAVAATALTAPAHAAPSVSAVALDAPSSVEAGAPITVTVAATGAVDLYAYDLAVSYDPDLVELVEDSAVTPDGGFSDVADDGSGTVAVTHTRLGTSPGLEGDVTLATLTFTAVAGGDAPFAVPTATLVGADGTTASLTDAASATTTVTAVVTAPPTGDPTDGATSAPPTGDGTTAPGADDASDSPSTSTGSGSLASTGGSVAWLAGAALLAVVVGAGILWARRRAVVSR